MSAKVIQVIEAVILRGDGTSDDPGRQVVQYWTFDGTLLFERDNYARVAEQLKGKVALEDPR